jgi:hypothetical protein
MGCEKVYIASDYPLPLIEHDVNAHLWVGSLDELDEEHGGVRGLFTKHHVYFIGSHLGCGCGFSYDPDTLEERFPGETEEFYEHLRQFHRELSRKSYPTDEEYQQSLQQSKEFNEAGRQSVKRLADYLSTATEAGPVELYVRWGEEFGEPEHRESVSPAYFGGKSFRLVHKAIFTVRK